MRPQLLLTINWKFAVDFFAGGLHTRTAVARLPLRQLGFLVFLVVAYSKNDWTDFNAWWIDGSSDAVSHKEVPFEGLDNDR